MNLKSWYKYRIHKEGLGFFAFFVTGTLFLYKIHIILGLIATWGSCWCLYFFRIPYRKASSDVGAIVSPADGHVVSIQNMVPPAELNLGADIRARISIFLTIFDVHMNYVPIQGKIRSVRYQKGHFFHAGKAKASEQNEQNTLIIDIEDSHDHHRDLGVVQIAGLVARRIRCDIQKGAHVQKGQFYGLIRFGSRVDVYLPVGVHPIVHVGDRVLAVSTILARI